MEQVADPWNPTDYSLKLDDSKIYVVSPASDKIVKLAMFGGSFSHSDAPYANANKTVETTLDRAWDVVTVTNSVAGVVKSFQ